MKICTMSSSGGQGVGSINGGMNTNQPLSASNAPAGGGTGNAPAPAAQAPAAGPATGGGPINQVLPGGGTRVENPTPAIAAPGAPVALPTAGAPAVPQVAQAKPPAAAVAPAIAPPAATAMATHPTSAPTTPAAMDTPTVKVVVRPTAPPTKAAPAALERKPKPAANAGNAPQAEQSSGWFGCQIAAGVSATPLLGLGLLAAIGAGWQRRQRSRRNSRTQR